MNAEPRINQPADPLSEQPVAPIKQSPSQPEFHGQQPDINQPSVSLYGSTQTRGRFAVPQRKIASDRTDEVSHN